MPLRIATKCNESVYRDRFLDGDKLCRSATFYEIRSLTGEADSSPMGVSNPIGTLMTSRFSARRPNTPSFVSLKIVRQFYPTTFTQARLFIMGK